MKSDLEQVVAKILEAAANNDSVPIQEAFDFTLSYDFTDPLSSLRLPDVISEDGSEPFAITDIQVTLTRIKGEGE